MQSGGLQATKREHSPIDTRWQHKVVLLADTAAAHDMSL